MIGNGPGMVREWLDHKIDQRKNSRIDVKIKEMIGK